MPIPKGTCLRRPAPLLTAQVFEELAQLLPLHDAVDVAHKDGARHQLALLLATRQVRVVDLRQERSGW